MCFSLIGYLSVIGNLSKHVRIYTFEVIAYDCRGIRTSNSQTVEVINQLATSPSLKLQSAKTILNPCQKSSTIGRMEMINFKNQKIHSINITFDGSSDKKSLEGNICYHLAF